MTTLRRKQLMPTGELLELIYTTTQTSRDLLRSDPKAAMRDVIDAVELLADLVDREATRHMVALEATFQDGDNLLRYASTGELVPDCMNVGPR